VGIPRGFIYKRFVIAGCGWYSSMIPGNWYRKFVFEYILQYFCSDMRHVVKLIAGVGTGSDKKFKSGARHLPCSGR